MEKINVKFLIIGAGLSGLLSKYYLNRMEEMDVLVTESREQYNPKKLAAFYIHKHLDDYITPKAIKINYIISSYLAGKSMDRIRELYRTKVYGTNNGLPVSIRDGEEIGWETDWNYLVNLSYILYGHTLVEIDKENHEAIVGNKIINYQYLINTIPRTKFEYISRGTFPNEFNYIPIFYRVEYHPGYSRESDKMTIIYHPDPDYSFYRETLYKERIIMETTSSDITGAEHIFYPGKIFPVSSDLRASMIMEDGEYGIYHVGRYAKWEPKYKVHQTEDTIKEILNDIR